MSPNWATAKSRSMQGQRALPRGVAIVLLPLLVALAAGMWSGLARLGVETPATVRLLTINHGALMVSGVVGTVIGLERAVAMGRPLAYAGPLLSASGALVLVLAPTSEIAPAIFAASATAVVILFLAFLRRQVATPMAVMSLGVSCWLAGNLTWVAEGWATRVILPWWIAFLALTIAGERMELTRFIRLGWWARVSLWSAVAFLGAGPAIAVSGPIEPGLRVVGVAVLVLGLWLLWKDTARRTYRRGGVASYAGVALLAAYAWLVVCGIALVAWALEPGLRYDTTLHAFFLGFVFGAIFAHAPIILPAITGRSVQFTPLFWIGLVLLHGSLAVRIAANLIERQAWREGAGVFNVVAVVVLVAALVTGFILGARDRSTAPIANRERHVGPA